MSNYSMILFFSVISLFADQPSQPFYIAQKYASTVDERIERCVQLCLRLAHHSVQTTNTAKVLVFSVPSIIHCYNTFIRSGNVWSIYELWQSHKLGRARVLDKNFKYEFCHLLFIVLEHFAIQMLDANNLSKQEQDMVNQISATLPMDDLLNMIDIFYQRLMEFLAKTDQQKPGAQWRLPIAKRWVALGLVCVVFAQKIYNKWFAPVLPGVTGIPAPIPSVVSTKN